MSNWVKLTDGGVGSDCPVYINLDQIVEMVRTGSCTCLRHAHRHTADILVKETPEQILGKACRTY